MKNVTLNLLAALWILSRFLSNEASEVPPLQKAYLDPGTGSMIISAIIGVFATIVLGFKTFGYKMARLFRLKPKKSEGKPSADRPEKT